MFILVGWLNETCKVESGRVRGGSGSLYRERRQCWWQHIYFLMSTNSPKAELAGQHRSSVSVRRCRQGLVVSLTRALLMPCSSGVLRLQSHLIWFVCLTPARWFHIWQPGVSRREQRLPQTKNQEPTFRVVMCSKLWSRMFSMNVSQVTGRPGRMRGQLCIRWKSRRARRATSPRSLCAPFSHHGAARQLLRFARVHFFAQLPFTSLQ